MDECIDFFGEPEVFSSSHANSGNWKVEIEKTNRDKIAFTYHHGLYCLVRMLFGLRSAPETFPRTIYVILLAVIGQFLVVYFDDIIVFLQSPHN